MEKCERSKQPNNTVAEQNTSQQILEMLKVVTAVSEGNYNTYCQLGKEDDLGVLALGINMMVSDIKEFVKNEKELLAAVKAIAERDKKRAVELYQIYNGSPSGMRVIDKNFNVVSQNEAMTKLSGLAKESGKEFKCYEQFKGKPCGTPECTLKRVLEKRELIFNQEIEKETPSGKKIPCRVLVAPFKDEQGNITGVIEIFIDITEIKFLQQQEQKLQIERARAEAESIRARELEIAYSKLKEMQQIVIQAEKLNAVGQLASGIAHEVKNPLAIIMQSVEYLLDKIPPEQQEIFKMIKENIKRADKIVRALVDFSRVTEISIVAQEINPILEVCLILMQHELKGEKIKIVKELGENLPDVLIDKNKIEQVFINILMNAIQAMPSGGTLCVRSYLIEFEKAGFGIGRRESDSFKVGERAVVVEIEDTGVGVSQENMEKVFDPFFTTKGPKEGAGLGLSVSKNIITMHKGIIEIKNNPVAGARVRIILKIKEPLNG